MTERTNTICTAGDANYLWGLFLLIASLRRNGMSDPVLVGVKGFSDRDRHVLEQFGDVTLVSLEHADYSLTCAKAEVMLQAKTDFVTWADSDAMFRGDCSALLCPPDADTIRVRRRRPPEMPGAFPKPYDLSQILPRWRLDVASAAGLDVATIPEVTAERVAAFCSCSACYLSVARSQEKFLRVWHEMMMRLPRRNVGVVDRSLTYYHQLDESCLNACLEFLPEAPAVTEVYGLDLDVDHLYIHFIGRPKPWEGWVPRAVRHIETVVSTVEWAQREGFDLPGPIPAALKRERMDRNRRWAAWTEFAFKVRNRLKRYL